MVCPIIHRVLNILLVVQDLAAIHSMDRDLLYNNYQHCILYTEITWAY